MRYVCAKTNTRRYDLIILTSESLEEKGEVVIIDDQGSRYTKVRKNKIQDSEYLAHAFNVNEYESDEIYQFLKQVLE
ncbi:SAV0927 family protein [Piscibacillus salipiscarius]|uniref:SAV0927 family protein n=1 Tax=Piscibacillus salipiscarius TaxID=299480 RepID=UPI0034E21941